MTDQRKLELTLCDGLPHGLKVMITSNQAYGGIETIKGINTRLGGSVDFIGGTARGITHVKPILFDLSSLTEEITIGGETFVPIDRIKELFPNVPNWYRVIDKGHVIKHYLNQSALTTSNTEYVVIQKLNEWHFNTRGLNPDQFINVKDLRQNPY